ncbi:MAG: GNAT family N-acetyltransferase [Candidatus Aminicenantes bacterium]|nr:GNAT family N-acetyltransferase [Candidatus Aminicenantes bacterium]
MSSFIVQRNPSSSILQKYSQLAGDSCFYREEFLRASVFAGSKIVAFSIQNNGALASFAVGFETKGLLSSILTFPTFPRIIDPDPDVATLFWSGLKSYCKQRRIYKLRLNSFGAIPINVPELGIPTLYIKRSEYLLDLTLEPVRLFENFSSNHRRNIRKAKKQNFIFKIVNTLDACRHHGELIEHSMNRRRLRGETVPSKTNLNLHYSLVSTGAASLMQLARQDEIISSFLILTSHKSAYYQSGGTSKKGMELGASHYLMWKTIEYLHNKGLQYFNLGGVTEHDSPGLLRYKVGFGAKEIKLAHLEFFMGSNLAQKVHTGVRAFKQSLRNFLVKALQK